MAINSELGRTVAGRLALKAFGEVPENFMLLSIRRILSLDMVEVRGACFDIAKIGINKGKPTIRVPSTTQVFRVHNGDVRQAVSVDVAQSRVRGKSRLTKIAPGYHLVPRNGIHGPLRILSIRHRLPDVNDKGGVEYVCVFSGQEANITLKRKVVKKNYKIYSLDPVTGFDHTTTQ